ncbi:MAG: siderophore ABC transporter substrate-binding protein [Cellulosilyticaceae bacterium]
MKKYYQLIGVLALGLMSLVGCGAKEQTVMHENVAKQQQETMVITHRYGEVVVPVAPRSVAVFDFGVLDTLQQLGVEVITGVVQDTTSRPSYLEMYGSKDYTNIGGLKEPNFEALYELAPEIIFISGRQGAHYEELSKIAPVVFMEPDTEDYMGSLEQNVMTLAQIFKKEEVAQSLLQTLGEKVDDMAQTVRALEGQALITMVSKGEVSVFGEGSRFGVLYNAFGFENADANIEQATHGQVVTFEYLAKTNPDYLFVVDKNSLEAAESQTAKDTLDNPLVKGMDAAKANHIIYLDPVAWYISPGGLSATLQMIEDVNKAL